MLAFVRVFAFYIAMAALLTWALFALGWNDALEMPGFEGTRTVAAPPKPASEPPPAKAAAAVVEERPLAVAATRKPIDVAANERPEIRLPETRPPAPAQPAVAPLPGSGAIEVPPAIVREKPKDAVVAVPVTPPAQAPAQPVPPAIAPVKRVDPPTKAPAVVPEPPRAPPVQAIAVPSPPAPPAPPVALVPPPQPPPAAKPPVATAAARNVAPPPPQTTPVVPQVRAPVAQQAPQTARPRTSRWAPQRRIAGFDSSDLSRQLADSGKVSDDVPCIAFRDLAFTPGTPRPEPRASRQLGLIAKALAAAPNRQVEIGSRLGPGRPMASDKRLRADRVRIVRDTLIRYGVAPGRLLVDPDDAYERVADDIGRAAGGRVQSIGICVHD